MKTKTRRYFLVLDDPFNQKHHPQDIGKIFVIAPSYCKVKQIKPKDGDIITNTAAERKEFLYDCGYLIPITS